MNQQVTPISIETINLDCYGRSYIQDLTIEACGKNWRFIFDPKKKQGMTFHLGLFLDRGIMLTSNIFQWPAEKRIIVLEESPNEPQFKLLEQWKGKYRLLLTHDKNTLENSPHATRLDYGICFISHELPINNVQKSSLLSFMGSIAHPDVAGYPFRKQVAARLAQLGVPCFGKGIKPVTSKTEALLPYAFSVAMENVCSDWYYTEKLIDCILCETVPLYWGCPSIGEILDTRGLIVFNSLEELETLVADLSMDKYESMLPYIKMNKEKLLNWGGYTYKSHYTRIAELIHESGMSLTPISTMKRNRWAGLIRKLIGKTFRT